MFKKIFIALLAGVVLIHSYQYVTKPVLAQTTEAERNKQLVKELTLNLPEQIDDPNYPVTFVDPSKKGVELTLNGKTTANAPSPFLLPNLTVGAHEIIFKYTNTEGLVRVLAQTIYLVPKAPTFDSTLKTTVVRPAQVIISGVAIPQSTVQLIVNSQSSFKTTSSAEGKWEFTIPNPTEGKLNIVGQTIKNGFVSEVSKTFTVEYKLEGSAGPVLIQSKDSWQDIFQREFMSLVAQVENYRVSNPNEFYIVIGVVVVLILAVLLLATRKRMSKHREEKDLAALFGDIKSTKTILDIVSDNPEISRLSKERKVKIPQDKKKSKKKIGKTAIESAPPKYENIQTKKKQKQKTKGLKITKEILTESDDQNEGTTKKILSKEEFLKQFKPKNARTEE